MPVDLNGLMGNVPGTIAAIGALGVSAYGLVDSTKVAWGGISRVGYGRIERALQPFEPALRNSLGRGWGNVIFSHWLNGVPLADQKTKAKTLIRLGLNAENALQLATASTSNKVRLFDPNPSPQSNAGRGSVQAAQFTGSIDAEAFQQAVVKLTKGVDLQQTDINVLGRFDALVDAALDAAYERADQQYRNAARGVAALVAIALALVGDYFAYDNWFQHAAAAIVVGVIAVPLAPVAKDLSSALTKAVSAMNAVTGKKS